MEQKRAHEGERLRERYAADMLSQGTQDFVRLADNGQWNREAKHQEAFKRIEIHPPSQKTAGLPVDDCAYACYATARCRPQATADNRVAAEGEDGYFMRDHGFTGGAPLI
jgi:uncharacterized membrane protein YccC